MIFEKIKTKVSEGKLTTYYCFGKPIFQNIVSYKNGKRKHYHRFYSYEKIRSDYD